MKKKHSLIIGGTRGLGRAVAKLFASENHLVSVVGRKPPADVDSTIPNIRYWMADLQDAKGLTAALSEILLTNGKLNHLVLCQRYRGSREDLDGDWETGLTASRNVIEQVADSFDETGEKSIVLIGSAAGQFVVGEQSVGYHAAKAGMAQIARYYAVTLGAKGIRVNCVSPGTFVKEESKQFYADHPEITDFHKQITPLGRMGTAEDVAGVVEFLCSSKASFLTGQDIMVDGGISLQGQESLARKLTSLKHLPITQQTPKP